MADFSAADIKRLRELTGAGFMDCKRALEEADGDQEAAVEILRVKGAKDVDKRAERVAANGLVASTGGAIIELNCETDFVAKNDQFQQLAAEIVQAVQTDRANDVPSALDLVLADGRTVQEAVQSLSSVIGEKLELRRVAVLDGTTATYLHRKDRALPPQVGVLVAYEGDDGELARTVGMQVAAMSPRYMSRDEVPPEVVDTERRVAEQKAVEAGKPAAALPKIVEGSVNTFYKQTVLPEQEWVQDRKRTVAQVLADAGVTVTGFVRFEVGVA
jgi:elongation factor Ts